MKNMRISGKLLVSFGGIGVLLVGLVAFAISQLASMNRLSDTAVNNRLPKLMLAQEMEGATVNFRVTEGVHILLNDDAGMSAAEGKMRDLRAQVDRDYQRLIATVQNPSARVALSRFHGTWAEYLGRNVRLRALSRAHENDQATELMVGESQRTFGEMSKAANDLVDIEAQLAKQAGAEAVAVYSDARVLCGIALAVALAALSGIFILLVRQVAKPVSAATEALTALAAGRHDVVVPATDRADEVGALAKALVGLRDQLTAAERAKAEQTALIVDSVGSALSMLAQGDLVARVEADLSGPFAKLKTDYNEAARSLGSTLSQVVEAAHGINSGAGDIRQASDDLAQRTEQQAASLEQTAAAMEEITSTVRATAERAVSANAAVRGVRQDAEHSGEVVRDAVSAMAGIERTSAEISEISSVIDGIAFQTNLLALNAGVEAARAGDAGKGFAVVAAEVRALAQRSAEAAKDIKKRITASSEQVGAGVLLVREAGDALGRIVSRIGEVDGLVSEIAKSAEHQADGLQQVNIAVSDMDGVTQQNAAMVEQATAAARSLASEANALTQQIARFRTADQPADTSSKRRDQDRAEPVVRRSPKPVLRASGNTALAPVNDDWSGF